MDKQKLVRTQHNFPSKGMDDVNLAYRLLTERNKTKLITDFLTRLNTTQLNNFTKAANKDAWIKKWIRNKHGQNASFQLNLMHAVTPNTFSRYVNALNRHKANNMNIVRHMNPKNPPPYVNLKVGNKGYIQLEPVCKNNHNKGVYVHYGETFPGFRGQKVGFRLRNMAVRAARNSNIPLYQVSQNIEGLIARGNDPITARIMKKLGAIQMNSAPPCRHENKRGPQNLAFRVGGVEPPKKPSGQKILSRRRNV